LPGSRSDYEVELVPIVSEGDTDPRPLAEIGERGIFASALEKALLDGTIDAAVHSCKDLPLEDTAGLTLACVPFREDPRDVLCGVALSVDELPDGARIATGSARRSAALRTLRADLTPVAIRGNVATRLTRSAARGDDACMLAAAGLNRLGLRGSAGGFALEYGQVVPEAGQGIVVVQTRTGDDTVRWDTIDDREIRWVMDVERSVAHLLGGGCEHPVGVHVNLADRRLAGRRSGLCLCRTFAGRAWRHHQRTHPGNCYGRGHAAMRRSRQLSGLFSVRWILTVNAALRLQ